VLGLIQPVHRGAVGAMRRPAHMDPARHRANLHVDAVERRTYSPLPAIPGRCVHSTQVR
jgi:hypothetical protein